LVAFFAGFFFPNPNRAWKREVDPDPGEVELTSGKRAPRKVEVVAAIAVVS